jgi:hypothetical protein
MPHLRVPLVKNSEVTAAATAAAMSAADYCWPSAFFCCASSNCL